MYCSNFITCDSISINLQKYFLGSVNKKVCLNITLYYNCGQILVVFLCSKFYRTANKLQNKEALLWLTKNCVNACLYPIYIDLAKT